MNYNITQTYSNFNNNISNSWMKLGIIALAFSGIYSIVIVLLRMPGLSKFFLDPDIFKIALVIHVDLSVYVWMLCIANSIMMLNIRQELVFLNRVLLYVAVFSIIAITISPLISGGNPIINNYIPVVENLFFIIGLAFFTSVCFIVSVLSLFNPFSGSLICYTSRSLSIIFLIAFTSLLLSFYHVFDLTYSYPIDINHYYEMIFWGFGHILQFLYIVIMEFIWIALLYSNQSQSDKHFSAPKMAILSNIGFVIFIPIIYFIYNIDDFYLYNFFTQHMRYIGSISLVSIFALILFDFYKKKITAPKLSVIVFICSSSLFLMGGIIAILISGTNVTIPAHYHGSIVGISISMMGYIYVALGLEKSLICRKQIIIYWFGQMIHIIGLAISGGYGVLRKNSYAELSYTTKITMGIMGIGGLIAILAGLLFVVICLMKIFSAQSHIIRSST